MIKPNKLTIGVLAFFFLFSIKATAGNKNHQRTSTLDKKLQGLAETMLDCKQGSIVAIDPRTGEIKCMASNSFFNDAVNRSIGMAYSPGSTFKTAQALTLLSEHIVNEKSEYGCKEGFWRGNVHIGCHKHPSPMSMANALAHSCNAYFCKGFMAMLTNRNYKSKNEAIDKWFSYMQSMGLGVSLGVDMPGEVAGEMPNSALMWRMFKGRWNEQTIMWVGMGQGEVQATPLQLCNLAASIANRGFFFTPHIHRYNVKDELYKKYNEKHVTKVNAKAYQVVIDGMRRAVKAGTCADINTPLFDICGKTGTAENPGDDHSIFIGFAPMNNPKIAVCVYIENGGFGAEMAAPMAKIIMEQYLEGKLCEASQQKVKHWSEYIIVPN